MTDYIVGAILFYLFCKGWLKGFLRSLLGPISFVLAGFAGITYYQKTGNMPVSLSIGLFGPFVINFLISLLLNVWHKTVNKNEPIPLPSRLLGSSFNLLWGGAYLVMVLILINIVSIDINWFEKIQSDVSSSKSYTLVNQWFGKRIPSSASLNIKNFTNILKNPDKLKHFESTKEFKDLMDNDLMRKIFSNEETSEQLSTKNFGALLSNPDMQAIFKDKDLIKKLFEFNKKIIEENLGDGQ